MCRLDTLREGQRIAASGDIQNGQPLRLRLALQNPRNQPRHVVDVDELDFVVQIFLPERQHAGQPFCRLAHAGGVRAFAIGRAAERSQ